MSKTVSLTCDSCPCWAPQGPAGQCRRNPPASGFLQQGGGLVGAMAKPLPDRTFTISDFPPRGPKEPACWHHPILAVRYMQILGEVQAQGLRAAAEIAEKKQKAGDDQRLAAAQPAGEG